MNGSVLAKEKSETGGEKKTIEEYIGELDVTVDKNKTKRENETIEEYIVELHHKVDENKTERENETNKEYMVELHNAADKNKPLFFLFNLKFGMSEIDRRLRGTDSPSLKL